MGNGCLTCFVLRAKDCGHGANAREACLPYKMFHALWMRLDELIQKDHGPVCIRAFPQSPHQHFRFGRIHFVSILCVDMPRLN